MIHSKSETGEIYHICSGFNPERNTIGQIYQKSQQSGSICGIQEDQESGVCSIAHSKLSFAFKAVHKGKNIPGNKHLSAEFAIEPDPNANAAIDATKSAAQRKLGEITEGTTCRQAKTRG